MIGTIFSVQTEEAELEVHKKFSTSEDKEKPVTFIGTKFKVPATNSFDVFETGITKNEENDKRRIKFANTLEKKQSLVMAYNNFA